ncbi:hypothetical protein EC957_010858 [Mortierella hygrophila]|uniref:Epidermal growth factor receptor substrate 15-like 1 n=1 Tax=Mortierella hygrophila TaxID=979708 RepID=A0A9P6FAB3_9FUNG|nr:hypothetical protein EC957_010858 [Mortierella hygrophila]
MSRDINSPRRPDSIALSGREKQVHDQLWAAADVNQCGFIIGTDAVSLFAKSGLPSQTLGQVWLLADSDNKGVLGQRGFNVAVRLIAHAQDGKAPTRDLIHIVAPLPHFEGITPAKINSPLSGSTSVVSHSTGSDPIISESDRTKYANMFMAVGPVGGLLDGDKAREVFLKSKLPVDKLSQIWGLADTKVRGSLDLTDFTIAMFYIQRIMEGSISTPPATLPPSVLKAAAGSAAGVGLMSSPVLSAQTLARQVTGGNMGIQNPAITSQMTGSMSLSSSPLAKENTGGLSDDSIPWEITPEEKAKFDRFFDQLDANDDGVVEGEEAGRFFMNSRLPDSILAQIWDLSDITKTGSLNKDEFAVAMFLINRKNASNNPIPKTLPLSLVPPSFRARSALSQPSSQIDDFFSGKERKIAYDKPSRNSTPNVVEGLFRSTRPLSHKQQRSLPVDLFDLPLTTSSSSSQINKSSDDSLPLDLFDLPLTTSSSSSSSSSSPQTNKTRAVQSNDNQGLRTKLVNEDDDLSIRSKLNQEIKATKDLKTERAQLEEQISRAQDMRGMMEQRLSNLKTQKERESKTVDDLKSSLASMESEMANLRMAIGVSKRELEVAQEDKRSFLKALAEGREESLELKASLQRSCDEVVELRRDLETRMRMLGLDPVDFPVVPGPGPGRATSQVEVAERNESVTRGPQFVRDDSIAISPRQRNPEFREPEPVRLGIRGPQDHGDFHGAGLNKTMEAQPWHLLAQQESLSWEQ